MNRRALFTGVGATVLASAVIPALASPVNIWVGYLPGNRPSRIKYLISKIAMRRVEQPDGTMDIEFDCVAYEMTIEYEDGYAETTTDRGAMKYVTERFRRQNLADKISWEQAVS